MTQEPEILRVEPSDFLRKFDDGDCSNRISELIDAGVLLTAHTEASIAEEWGDHNPYYYHEVRKMYVKWRAAARKFLKSCGEEFLDEREFFEESDSIPSAPLVYEAPDFPNKEGEQELRDIRTETRKKLEVLREVRKKIRAMPRSSGGLVRKITIVEREYPGAPRRVIVVNDIYNQPRPFKILIEKGAGRLLYAMATQGRAPVHEYTDNNKKYWNSNKKTPIYKRGGYQKTTIVKKEGAFYVPGVELRTITKATYKYNRQKMGDKS